MISSPLTQETQQAVVKAAAVRNVLYFYMEDDQTTTQPLLLVSREKKVNALLHRLRERSITTGVIFKRAKIPLCSVTLSVSIQATGVVWPWFMA